LRIGEPKIIRGFLGGNGGFDEIDHARKNRKHQSAKADDKERVHNKPHTNYTTTKDLTKELGLSVAR